MKTPLLLAGILAFFISSCQNSTIQKNVELDQIQARKHEIDQQLSDKSLVVYAKVKGREGLVEVKNKRYPVGIETTYNIMRDKSGKIVYVAEVPYSPTSDWFIVYKNYFGMAGNLIVFQRVNNFMNSKCVKGAALENLTRYYGKDFRLIDSAYTLTDSSKKPLDKKTCEFPYNFKYEVYKNLTEYKAGKAIVGF